MVTRRIGQLVRLGEQPDVITLGGRYRIAPLLRRPSSVADVRRDPEFRKKFGPRGVIRSYADGRIDDTGPLTKKRMETIDEEIHTAAMDFIDRPGRCRFPYCRTTPA